MEQAFKAVKKLVEDFRAQERNYLSPSYQESHVRQGEEEMKVVEGKKEMMSEPQIDAD